MTAREEYIRKILEIGCNVKENNNIVVLSYSNIDSAKEEFLKLKDEYNIDQLIFFDKDKEKLYNFFKTNPSNQEISEYIHRIPTLKNPKKTRIIFNYPSDYNGYESKLINEFNEKYDYYKRCDGWVNSDLYFLMDSKVESIVITSLPDKTWANHLLGSPDKEDELWEFVNRTIPNIDEYNRFIEHKLEIKEYLQRSRIKNLTIHTDIGSDFRIGLTRHSLWLCAPEEKDNELFHYNFPSYEIFTSPDCYTCEGKIVLSRPSMYFGRLVNNAEFTYRKGKCIKVDTDCEYLEKTIRKEGNGLNRIGEIALVPNDSPISKIGKNFDSLLIDENAGCHFAIGYAINDSINLDKGILLGDGKLRHHFNDSKWHHDFVFGDNSVSVEATCKNNKKILLLENGTWKI